MERRRLLTAAAASTPTPLTGGGIIVLPYINNLYRIAIIQEDNPYIPNIDLAWDYVSNNIPFLTLFIPCSYTEIPGEDSYVYMREPYQGAILIPFEYSPSGSTLVYNVLMDNSIYHNLVFSKDSTGYGVYEVNLN